ncbi:MAG: NusG domain II-containing protein [Lachnospiraceae bacterium]|nr:NusG domain II-containing protein [Lachnospiraceae bacterium]
MKKKDILLILVVLAVGVFTIASFRAFQEEGGQVVVTVAGEEYATLPLNKDARLEIEGKYGTNILAIKDGTAKMEEAGCPDQICVYHKAIQYNGDTIICLPNQIIIQVVDGEDQKLDSVAQ